jgi:amino acid transporter
MTTDAQPTSGEARLTVRGAIFLGVGAMVGAGIFSLLGQAGVVAGAAVWVSFLIAGAMSAALGYTMVKLGVRYPTSGGLVTYLERGFGTGRLVGVASWLGYLTAIVVVGAMVAVSFGDYAATLVVGADASAGWSKLFAALLVLAAAWLTVAGPQVLDRAQTVIVVLLLAVFAVFVAGTVTHLHTSFLAPSGYPDLRHIIASVALTFFAFLGFAVISFAAGDLARPRTQLPRAMYSALGVTTVLYVAVSLCVFGTLPVEDVIRYGPTAIAEAARPTLGDAGFVMMAVAALLATSSSVTATLYASEGLTTAMAESGTFPAAFGTHSRLGRHGGLIITTTLTIVALLALSLGALASVGSAVSLAVFVLVALSAYRLRDEIGASAGLVVTAIVIASVVLVGFTIDLLLNDRSTFWFMVALVLAGVAVNEIRTRTRATS